MITEGPDAAFGPEDAGPASDAVLRRYGIEPGSRYLLYVGGLSPHKNLPRLIEAFALGATPEARLILVGDLGDVFHTHVPALREAVERFGLGDRAHFTGFVPDADLAHLYRRAYALAQPSLMEGFGLPAGRGDGLRDPGALQHGGLAARGRRRGGRLLRPDRRRGDGRRDPLAPGSTRRTRPPGRGWPWAGRGGSPGPRPPGRSWNASRNSARVRAVAAVDGQGVDPFPRRFK